MVRKGILKDDECAVCFSQVNAEKVGHLKNPIRNKETQVVPSFFPIQQILRSLVELIKLLGIFALLAKLADNLGQFF